jgi:hypothetical protein
LLLMRIAQPLYVTCSIPEQLVHGLLQLLGPLQPAQASTSLIQIQQSSNQQGIIIREACMMAQPSSTSDFNAKAWVYQTPAMGLAKSKRKHPA